MPTIESYEPLAPFTIDELVEAVNAILRDRPSMHIQARTVRFYISNGLLSPPHGGPKYARYGMEHLRRIVATRQWLEEGVTLEEAARRIERGEHGTRPEQPVLYQSKRSPSRDRVLSAPMPSSASGTKRVPLTRHSTLEVDLDADFERELDRSIHVMEHMLRSLRDTY